MAINLLLQVFYLCQEPLVHEYLKMTEKTTEKRRNFSETQSRDKRGWQSSGPSPAYCNMTSWFAIVLAQIRTRWILREKADSKQSNNHSTSLPEKG